MIEVRDLRVDYDDVCAVSDLTLQIPAGEIYGLIGPNGAGKTTTLRAMMGLLEPTYGDIVLGGCDLVTQREEAIRQVGFMPDFAPLYEDLTVYEFLDLFAASYFVPRAARKPTIEKYLELVELSAKRDAMTLGLSRGMKQRLILAKTLLPEPRIVLLDEPASGMDPHARLLLKNILKSLGEMGKTVIISSHILPELSEFCTSIGVMERGHLVVSGRVEDIALSVLGTAQVMIEVFAGADILKTMLAADGNAGEQSWEGNTVVFPYDGTPEATSDLLDRVIAGGVRVAAYGRKKEDLEEVFLKIGAREVS